MFNFNIFNKVKIDDDFSNELTNCTRLFILEKSIIQLTRLSSKSCCEKSTSNSLEPRSTPPAQDRIGPAPVRSYWPDYGVRKAMPQSQEYQCRSTSGSLRGFSSRGKPVLKCRGYRGLDSARRAFRYARLVPIRRRSWPVRHLLTSHTVISCYVLLYVRFQQILLPRSSGNIAADCCRRPTALPRICNSCLPLCPPGADFCIALPG